MTRLTPIEINLKELPPEGQTFSYTTESAELTPIFRDLIGQNPFRVDLKITPMGNTFDLKGTLSTAMDLECSLCAIDFKFPVELKLHELIMINKSAPLGKNEHQGRANHAHEWESEGPDYILLESPNFNIGNYLHEMIALSEPIKPLGRPNCDENCENLKDRVQRSWLSYGSGTGPEDIKSNPFQVLEKIKLKS